MSAGTWKLSCGVRREALEVLGVSESAEAKSWAVGFVRRLTDIEVRA